MNFTRISRAAALASIAVLLLGCGAAEPVAPSQPVRRGFGERAAWARQSVLDSRLPAEVRAALEQLGMLKVEPGDGTARAASTALPHTLAANHAYAGAGDAGYLSHSSNVTLGLNGMDLQPSGAVFPDSFAYIVYRVDDIAQALTTLEFSFGLLGPGAEVGVAAYDWTYGSLGHWEPLAWEPAVSGMTVPLASQYISPGGDLVFAVFCLSPSQLELQSMVVGTNNAHPDYDELEPNDMLNDIPASLPLANELPAIPFTGYRGNIGSNGEYDGSVDDYFWFTGQVGEMYKFTITPEFPSELFQPWALDSDIVEIGHDITGPSGAVTVTVIVTTGQTQPLYLNVWHQGLATDYTIDAERLTAYGELEDNDFSSQSNDLGGGKFFINGSLGQPNGYDNDFDDFFLFYADFDEQPQVVLWYDSATLGFDFLNFAPRVIDSAGTTMCFGQPDVVPDTILFRFDQPINGSHFPPFYINLEPAAGGSNYWLTRLNNYVAP